MANTPAWFDEAYYLSSKLAQLRSKGLTQYQNIVDVKVALEAAGYTPFSHFQAMGLIERTSPNQYFNATEYLNAKAQQVNAKQGVTTWNADQIALAIYDAGMTIWEHFQKFGWKEGVNPSNAFDVNAYFESKLAAVQAKDPDGGWTLEKVKAAFEEAGLDPITHYVEYGKNEAGVTVSPAKDPVPSDDRTDGEVFTLTIGEDNIDGTAGNDIFSAPVLQSNTGTAVDTLEAIDSLNGGDGNDTLNATVTATAAAAPSLKSVENVNVRFAADNATVSLANATGVENVTVQNSTTTAGNEGTVAGVGSIANLAVKNQATGATFTGNTATSLNLGLDTVGVAGGAAATIDLDNVATTLSVAANNANATFAAGKTAAVTTLNVAASGSNTLTALAAGATAATITGAGSVNLATAFTALTKLDASANTGGVTATVAGAAVDVKGGTGNDSITYTAAVAATAVVDLGAGDDTLTLQAAPAAGATLSGGEGTDTLALAGAGYVTVSGYGATDLAKITGFEVLSITDALTAGASVDVSKIAGITSFQTVGVVNGGAATVSGLGANAAVILKGDLAAGKNDGALTLTLKDTTGSADAVNLTLNHTDAIAAGAAAVAVASTVNIAGVETLNVNTAVTSTTAGVTDAKAEYTLTVGATATDLTTVNVSGSQALSFTSNAAMTKLATIDASALTAAATIDASAHVASSAALTIKGSATAANTLTGGATNDAIFGGAKNDTIEGGKGGDTLTGNGGNDTFVFKAGDSAIGTGTFDTITDFVGNTAGNAATGAISANADSTKWTGDVLSFTAAGTDVAKGFKVFTASNASDATTFLANTAAADGTQASAALDASANKLYVDVSGDGVSDFYISLTGVTAIDAANFVLV